MSTRTILSGIRKLLPFGSDETPEEAERITTLANRMVDTGLEFLKLRDPVVHHIGNPTTTFKDIEKLCNGANIQYKKFLIAHREFFETAQPYRFGIKELDHFYGKRKR